MTVFAGTHAFQACDEALASYPDFIHFKPVNPFLVRSGGSKTEFVATSEETRRQHTQDNRKKELQRLKEDDGYDAKSVLPIVHYDGSVSLRLKEMPSPFERTNTVHHGRSQFTRSERMRRRPQIFHTLEVHNSGKKNCEFPVRPDIAILPLVCSEALQLPDALEESKVVVILAYHKKPQDFMSLALQARLNGKLVVLANDGAFGGSGVFITPDERAENWWFGEPNNGKLPAGDGILLVDADLDRLSPELGKNNPHYPNGIVALAAIVPGYVRSFEAQVAETTAQIEEAITSHIGKADHELKCGDQVSRIRSLVNSPRVGAIQQLKLWRIRELLQLHNLTPDRASVWCEDARIYKGRKNITFLLRDTHYEPPQGEELSLRELESRLAWETIQFLEHESSIANEKGMLHDAADLVAVKRLLESRRGRTSATSPLTNVLRALSQNREEAVKTARSRLSRRLGKIVERFGGTSGWMFLVRSQPKGKKSTASRAAIEKQKSKFFPVAAYNAPELFIDRDVQEFGSGIVGRVAYSGSPYLANDVTDERHASLYLADVPSTRSELSVPLVFSGELLGVLNIEANYRNAFSIFDVNLAISEGMRLITDLLVLEASESAEEITQWHPLRHGWQLTPYLDSLCDAIAKALPTLHGSPSIGCSVWALDAAKESVSILGTARFDFEYVAERSLGVATSHIGNAILALLNESEKKGMECDRIVHPGSSLYEAMKTVSHPVTYYEECRLVSDLQGFKRKRKARRMELRTITVFPFFVRSADASTPPVACAMALYGFEHEWGVRGVSLNQMFTPTVGHNLVAEVGSAISNFFRQKTRIGAAYLIGRLHTDPTAARNPMETVKQVFQQVFASHGSTIFVKNQQALPTKSRSDSGHLSLVATTGITPVGPNVSADWKSYPLFPLDTITHKMKPAPIVESSTSEEKRKLEIRYHVGLTNYLGVTPDAVLRKSDAVDIEEPVLINPKVKEPVYFAPRNSLLESFAPGASEHMRFLGASVTDAGTDVVGVIRLTRTGTAPPFNVFDEFVIRAMCETVSAVFIDRRDQMQAPLNSSFVAPSASNAEIGPFGELSSEISKKYGPTFNNSLGASFANVSSFLSTMVSSTDPIAAHVHTVLRELIPYFKEPSRTSRTARKLAQKGTLLTIQTFLESLHQVMLQWGQSASTVEALELRRRLLLHSSVELRNSSSVGAILEDLNALCRSIFAKKHDPAGNPTVLSSIRCVQRHYSEDGLEAPIDHLRVLSVQPAWTSEKPDEDFRDALPRPRTSIANGWRVVDGPTGKKSQPLSYVILTEKLPKESFHRMHPHSAAVKSGVCMPFLVSHPHASVECGDFSTQRVQCILSVDFALKSEELTDELIRDLVLPSMALAVEKLTTVLSIDLLAQEFGEVAALSRDNKPMRRKSEKENSPETQTQTRYENWIATEFVKDKRGEQSSDVAIQFWRSRERRSKPTKTN